MNKIGIIQGRLSPPVPGRLQAFPWSSWEAEFHRARSCGFDVIEWLFESERYEQNPIWEEAGLERIHHQIATTGVQLHSVCADYFMDHPFFRVSESERTRSVDVLNRLIMQAARLGIETILIPVLEVAEIRTETEKACLLESLSKPLALAQAHNIRLAVETELPAPAYRALIEECNHPALGVYYDTGNAAARGYDIAADIRMLGSRLYGVQIKDRTLGGPSVLLGRGDANFKTFFHALAEVGYIGPVVLQTAFGEDYMGIARAHLQFIRACLTAATPP
jgi:L-ribulose-5-phosphate 3-epimerase